VPTRLQGNRKFKNEVYGQLARIGKALASPRRLELLDLICQAERSVEQLADETAMSVANTSQHLRALHEAHLIESRREGRFVVYGLADLLVSDFYRSFRLLAEDRLAEIERIRQRFFSSGSELKALDRDTLLHRVKQGKVIVIDVRPTKEYRTAHIPQSLSIPLQELGKRLAELPHDKTIVAYCRGPYCVLAAEAVQLLTRHGFRAHRLEDSVDDWRARGLPLDVSASPTLGRSDE
jgi:rhodanese-related sulfurtransferase/DNA-binding transcriptional ArsR family regulator